MPPFSSILVLSIVTAVVLAGAGPVSAADFVWTEVGDAGDTLAGANDVVVPPGDELIRIEGTIDPQSDGADIYEIEITVPMAFTAFTTNGDSENPDDEFDAFLALFDENGFGVYANDDGIFDDGNSILPAGDMLSPMSPGTYYLAIYDDNYGALSELSMDGLIFPLGQPLTDVLGPTGPGGADPLLVIGTNEAWPSDPRAYTIEVPEPGALALSGAALACVLVVGRLRRS